MNTYLLDTSVIIDVLNSKRARDTLLLRLLSEGHLLACWETDGSARLRYPVHASRLGHGTA